MVHLPWAVFSTSPSTSGYWKAGLSGAHANASASPTLRPWNAELHSLAGALCRNSDNGLRRQRHRMTRTTRPSTVTAFRPMGGLVLS